MLGELRINVIGVILALEFQFYFLSIIIINDKNIIFLKTKHKIIINSKSFIY